MELRPRATAETFYVYPRVLELGRFSSTTDSLENQSSLNNFTDLKLNESELDYLIRMLYKKFDKPMTDSQAVNLNSVKDYA